MILNIYSDALYPVAPYAKSRIIGYLFLSLNPIIKTSQNVPIHIKWRTLRHVVTSSAKFETTAVFHNAQNTIHIRYMLQQLGRYNPKEIQIMGYEILLTL